MASKRQRGPSESDSLTSEVSNDSSLLSTDAPFPRGGGSDLTPLEIKRAGVEAANDLYDQTVAVAPPSKKQKKQKSHQKASAAPVPRTNVDPLTFSKITLGTILLGQVSECTPKRLKISLPNNLYGYVDADFESDVPPFMDYAVGTWLRATVTDLGEAPVKRLLLSLSPDLTNQTIDQDDLVPGMTLQGLVTSVEDRGAILSFGESVPQTGFVKAKNGSFEKGQYVFGTITKKSDRVITIETGKKDNILLKTVHQQPSLAPGTLVEVAVDSANTTGFKGTVFGHISVEADAIHAGLLNGKTDLQSKRHLARILYSVPADNLGEHDRKLRVSILPNVVDLQQTSNDYNALELGHTVKESKVIAVEPRLGLSLDIGLNKHAYAHISMIQDERVENLEKDAKFKVSTIHPSRIVGYSLVDDLYYVALADKILEQQYLSLQEVNIGVITTAKVQRILPTGGIIMNLGGTVSGLAAEYNLTDAKDSDSGKAFKVGKSHKIRVLDVDVTNFKMKLTCKKSIINWEGLVISEIKNSLIGKKTISTVVSVKDNGAVLEFFGGVRGFLPSRETADASPLSSLYRGQSLVVYVLDADEDHKKLILSGRMPGGDFESLQDLEILSSQNARVVEKAQDGFVVDIEPEGARCFLPFTHLADDLADAKLQAKKIKVGSLLTKSLVIGKRKGMGLLTRKAKLLAAAESGNFPTAISELERGQKYTGYIANINEELGAFVSFANNLVGLLPKTELVQSSATVKPGQTVEVYVSSIKPEKGKFMVTTQPGGAKLRDTYATGEEVEAVVTAVKAMQLNVAVGLRQGRIDMTELFNSFDDIKDPKNPLSQFEKGQVLKAKVIGLHDVHNHHFLPISHRIATHAVLELSLKETPSSALTADLEVGQHCLAFVNNITNGGDTIYASCSPNVKGVLSRLDVSSDPVEVRKISSCYPQGSALSCIVLQTAPALRLTTVAAENSNLAAIHAINPTGLLVRLPKWKSGFVSPTDSMDIYEELDQVYEVGDIVESKFIESNNGRDWVSLRASVLRLRDITSEITDPLILTAADLSTGDLVRGFVKNISDGGLFVELGRKVIGRVRISELSDSYLKDWKKEFKVGQVVTAKVVSKAGDGKIELTLKASVVRGEVEPEQALGSLIKADMIIEGTVRRVEDFGVFVNLGQTKLSGLCHKTEIADRPLSNLKNMFTVGDPVKVKVLRVNEEKNQVSLGMKASYFEDVDSDDDMEEDNDATMFSDNDENEISVGEDDEEAMALPDSPNFDLSQLASDSEASGSDNEGGEGLEAGFDWGASSGDEAGTAKAGLSDDDSDSDSDSDDEELSSRRRNRSKAKGFVEDITGQLDTKAPQSAQDFERLLVSDPNSSILWMKYMAFQTEQNEIDAARNVGRRALKEISHREEEERFNIWVALINLENIMGSPESTQEVFKESTHYVDACKMYLRMANIYDWSDKVAEADKAYKIACRKFGGETTEVWIQYMKFLFKRSQAEQARSLLSRALSQAPKRMAKELTTVFARQEFDNGDAERGRTLFEGLVSTFAGKLDVWSTYLDQEIKFGRTQDNKAHVEKLFERIIGQKKLSMKQAKLIFKKWLNYEVEQNDLAMVDKVKAKAAEFVKKHS